MPQLEKELERLLYVMKNIPTVSNTYRNPTFSNSDGWSDVHSFTWYAIKSICGIWGTTVIGAWKYTKRLSKRNGKGHIYFWNTCDYISPLWLESNGNPMSWIITAASKKRTWILIFSFQSPNFSSKCWSTCRLWHLQNRVHGIWKRYWENNRRKRSSPLFNGRLRNTSPKFHEGINWHW